MSELIPGDFAVEQSRRDREGEWWPLESHNGEADHEDERRAVAEMRRQAREFGEGFSFRVVDAAGAVVAGPVESGAAAEDDDE